MARSIPPSRVRGTRLSRLMLLLVGAAAVACSNDRPPPDLILVSIDTLRRDHLPVYGYSRNTAPTISAFAKSAVVFDEAIAACVNTAPSHASMLTGTYPLTHGITHNGYPLDPKVTTLPTLLKTRGYATAAFVSGWTLNGSKTGLDRGFDHYDDRFHSTRSAVETWRAAAKWLDRVERRRPIFLFFHLFEPHQPYRPVEPYAARFLAPDQWDANETEAAYNARLAHFRAHRPSPAQIDEFVGRYDAEILCADDHVGKLFDQLKSTGRFENSIIVVLSDHGETLAERRWVFAHGGRAYDEQIRIPLIIRFPGGRWGGGRRSADAHHVDLVPTILAYLRLPAPEPAQGISLMDTVRQPRKVGPRRPLPSHARGEPRRLYEFGRRITPRGLITSLRHPPYKLIAYPTKSGELFELFDLSADPAEKQNLANTRTGELNRLKATLGRLNRSAGQARPPTAPEMSADDIKSLKALGYMD